MTNDGNTFTIELPRTLAQRIALLASELGTTRVDVIDRAIMVLIEARKSIKSFQADENSRR